MPVHVAIIMDGNGFPLPVHIQFNLLDKCGSINVSDEPENGAPTDITIDSDTIAEN